MKATEIADALKLSRRHVDRIVRGIESTRGAKLDRPADAGPLTAAERVEAAFRERPDSTVGELSREAGVSEGLANRILAGRGSKERRPRIEAALRESPDTPLGMLSRSTGLPLRELKAVAKDLEREGQTT